MPDGEAVGGDQFDDNLNMKSALGLLTALLLITPHIFATGFITLADETTLPEPKGWQLVGDSSDYPFQLVTEDLDAEVLIFKSVVRDDQVITDEKDLKRSVDDVLSEVIPQLPDAKVQTNTGFTEGDRAGFVLEFTSTDTTTGVPIQHRLKGILYRRPEGHQLLFTVWAKSPVAGYSDREGEIKLIQDGFYYTGVHEPDVFARKHDTRWYLLATVLVVIALLYFFRTFRTRGDRVRFRNLENHWRCDCGRLNSDALTHCHRCGRERTTDRIT